jgi:hypothetical protein
MPSSRVSIGNGSTSERTPMPCSARLREVEDFAQVAAQPIEGAACRPAEVARTAQAMARAAWPGTRPATQCSPGDEDLIRKLLRGSGDH